MNIDTRQNPPLGRFWRVSPVVVVAVLGVGGTLAGVYLRTDAAGEVAVTDVQPASPEWVVAVVALALVQAAALWWRDRRAVGVLLVTAAADVAMLALSSGTLSVGTLAVMVAVYTVFRRRSGEAVYLPTGLAALVSAVAALVFLSPSEEIPAGWGLPFVALRTAIVYLLPALVAELVSSRSRAMALLRERAELAERERERSARDAVQQERALMARELHDIAAHHLSGIIVGAQAAGALVAAEPDRAHEYIRGVVRDAQLTLANLRQTVGLLRADEQGELAPAPSIAQIPELLAGLRAAGMQIDEEWRGDPVPLGPIAESAAYRMVQESLANARQHAPGAACSVSVTNGTAGTTIVVVNLASLTPGAHTGLGGHGLVGMRERAALTGSRLVVGPTSGGGWRNELTVPLPDPVDAGDSGAPTRDGRDER